MAILYSFLIYTPVLILFAWLLEWAVDTPSKKWASMGDIMAWLGMTAKKKKGFGRLFAEVGSFGAWSDGSLQY